ncbi:DASH family cryptochrome [Mucilaginibacter auburnensis]|uniref:Cryptochrome DASH n=1 Tax=Mucilaginibacter auburnensis TaxID=1457233 RepID=A0A2H9VN53_9SPHI|nr:DASH family cryptochrome [Mucilaginibacter auburnensis]PJJ79756.1 deoxyribodipyrimidine photo-lyase [Mucilaginibacter auburnensis]
MSDRTILVWFRNDLRIHDNEILLEAVRKADKVLPVYCFDPFYFTKNASGAPKTGSLRAKFLLESVADLRNNLRLLNSELIVRIGAPAEILPQLCLEYGVNEVYHHREVAHEETDISEQVEAALWKIKLNLKHFIGHTLYHKEDLPFPIKDIPDSFAVFRKKTERESTVRPVLDTPVTINTPTITDAGEMPNLSDLGLDQPVDDQRTSTKFIGGETSGLVKLEQYLASPEALLAAKGGRNVQSSKLSPWLSLGCLSMRQVYWAAKQQHTDALEMELLWRDYFRFMFKKHGTKYFKAGDSSVENDITDELFDKWKNGHTSVPFIDASMHKLNATGFISNFSRQMVASYLVNELEVDWRRGAAYFEEKLIDYSPASNWGNWGYVAGIGRSTRDDRYFNSVKNHADLATDGDFITKWLPEASADSSSLAAAI